MRMKKVNELLNEYTPGILDNYEKPKIKAISLSFEMTDSHGHFLCRS